MRYSSPLQKLANWSKRSSTCIFCYENAGPGQLRQSVLAAHCFLGLWECVHVFQGANLVSVIIWWSPRFMCKLPSSSMTKDLQCLHWDLAGALLGVSTALTSHGAFFGNRRKTLMTVYHISVKEVDENSFSCPYAGCYIPFFYDSQFK